MLIKKVVTECHRNFKLELVSNPNVHRGCVLSNVWIPNFVLYRNVFAFNPKPGNCLFWFKPLGIRNHYNPEIFAHFNIIRVSVSSLLFQLQLNYALHREGRESFQCLPLANNIKVGEAMHLMY